MTPKTTRILTISALVLGLATLLSFGVRMAPSAASSDATISDNSTGWPMSRTAIASGNATEAKMARGNQTTAPDTSRTDLPLKSPKTKAGSRPQGSTSSPLGVGPPNDNCANAVSINSCPFTDTVDTTGATDEAGEPQSDCTTQANSVWYTYVAGANPGVVTVDTCGSSPVDTAIMVWRVTAGPCDFASFVSVACNDDACGDGLQSSVSFVIAPGQTYKIQVGGFDGDTGVVTVNVACTIFNCQNIVINGTLGSNDPGFPGPRTSGNQLGRLNRNGIGSSCAVPKACNIFTATGARAFDAYTLTNNSGALACIFVNLVVNTSTGANYQSNAYLGSYDPNNICTNYLADPGLSSGGGPQTPTSFSFNLAAGASVVVVVHTTNPGETGGSYTLTVLGNLCMASSCTLTCPANITQSNDPNQCGAVVTYPAPTTTGTCGTITCSPPSGSFFPMGVTTVTCTPTTGSSCSFSVTVNDTQPPSITCPSAVTAVAAVSCPIAASSSTTVTYAAPTVTDNCPGVTAACVPPSGSMFPAGVTTVTCTATDGSGNTATCSFSVTKFSLCAQDDSNAATRLVINSTSGAYQFTCGGTTYSGTGTVSASGCTVSINHIGPGWRVQASVNTATKVATATLQQPIGVVKCTITDRNITNNTCQ